MPAADPRPERFVPRRRTAVSRDEVETVIARAVGLFGIVFAVQTVPAALGQVPALEPGVTAVLMALLYGAVLLIALASVARIGVRTSMTGLALLYLLLLACWPLFVIDADALGGTGPWLYYLANVATASAAVAMPLPWALAYTVIVSGWYSVLRVLPAGGAADPFRAILDGLYVAVLGLVVLAIIWTFRQAARDVDEAQAAALGRYDAAERQHATELERARVDALVHDSVLTTLLSAANAERPAEQELAARMAGDAIRSLDEAGAGVPRGPQRVGLAVLVRRLRSALSTFAAPFTVRVVNAAGVELSVEAVEAVYSASVQALVNSLQHADDPDDPREIRRELRIRGVGTSGVVVEISDDGRGFDPGLVPEQRLGLRISIDERMAGVGGSSRIRTALGVGTVVTVAWPSGVDRGSA
ncbi:sensor histidine kinase [Agromyces seonyuensis]|uniref:ATP-binding protein n=1 Tax=Agromyces seonyuensis TaxID=2662446 RepID=A0A6I4P7R1_9MICO|nr:ATP-binding protein [Agromyces seonyuensis]MWB99867.1 ATP-binding protein [Agromyces seonyuensis]